MQGGSDGISRDMFASIIKSIFLSLTPFTSTLLAGYKRAFMATVATLLLANAAFAQNIAPVSAPIITNVTPGDASGTIGFVPSRVTEGTPPVREYVVSCETIGVSDAGTIESK